MKDHILYDSIYGKCPEKTNHTDRKQSCGHLGLAGGGVKSHGLTCMGFPFKTTKETLELNSDDGFTAT